MIEIKRIVPIIGEMFFADRKDSFDNKGSEISWRCAFSDEEVVVGSKENGDKKSFIVKNINFTPIRSSNLFFGERVIRRVFNVCKMRGQPFEH